MNIKIEVFLILLSTMFADLESNDRVDQVRNFVAIKNILKKLANK